LDSILVRRKPLLVATLFAFCFSSSQSKLALAQQAPQNETGVRPWESYDGVRENLNLATGGLSLQIPLLKLPGRNGFDYSVSLDLNNQI